MQYSYSLPSARARAIRDFLSLRGRYDIEIEDIFQEAELARLEAEARGKPWSEDAWARAFCCKATKKSVGTWSRLDEEVDHQAQDLAAADPEEIVHAKQRLEKLDEQDLARAARAAELEAADTSALAKTWKVSERQARNRRRALLNQLASASQGELF